MCMMTITKSISCYIVVFVLLMLLTKVIPKVQDTILNNLKKEESLNSVQPPQFSVLSAFLCEPSFLAVINVNSDLSFASVVMQHLHKRRLLTLTYQTFNSQETPARNLTKLYCKHCTNRTVSYLILVDNTTTLLKHWHVIKCQLIWNFRARFLVFVTSKVINTNTCHSSEEYSLLFSTLWKKHNVINLYIQHMFKVGSHDCSNDVIYYEPFTKGKKKTFGMVRIKAIQTLTSFTQIETDMFHNMNGYPLKISLFDRLSSCFGVTYIKVNHICLGFDGFVLLEMGKYMNFNPVVRYPKRQQDFGHYRPNGESTGVLGDVLHGRADLGFNLFFVKHYGTEEFTFSNPVQSDNLCVVVPKAKQIPKWLTMLTTFESDLYMTTIAVYIVFAMLLLVFKKIRLMYSNKGLVNIDWVYLCLDIFQPVLSMSITHLSEVSSQRFIETCSILLGLIISSAFQSRLVATVGHPIYYKDIDTLEQLSESDFKILCSDDLNDTFSYSDNPVINKLQQKVVLVRNTTDLATLVERGDGAVFVRKSLTQLKSHYFRSEDGTEILHLVKECPVFYYLSYILPNVSPYLKKVNTFLNKLIESGLVGQWDEWVKFQNQLTDGKGTKRKELKVFDLIDLQLPFYILVCGLIIAFLTFILELLNGKF